MLICIWFLYLEKKSVHHHLLSLSLCPVCMLLFSKKPSCQWEHVISCLFCPPDAVNWMLHVFVQHCLLSFNCFFTIWYLQLPSDKCRCSKLYFCLWVCLCVCVQRVLLGVYLSYTLPLVCVCVCEWESCPVFMLHYHQQRRKQLLRPFSSIIRWNSYILSTFVKKKSVLMFEHSDGSWDKNRLTSLNWERKKKKR